MIKLEELFDWIPCSPKYLDKAKVPCSEIPRKSSSEEDISHLHPDIFED